MYYVYNMREHMNNTKIIFLNKNNLSDYLIQDNDNYYKTFNNNDMIVRNIKNINEYYQIINKSVVDSNDIIRNKILKCIKKIENKFNNKNYEYFNGNKFNNITWKIGFIKGKLYEEGLPHTRDQVIILPIEYVESINNDTLIRLLIHEKIHVYQKIYHDDIAIYLINNNFTMVDNNINININNKRANPDMDDKLYMDKDNNIYYSQYNKNPKSIMDVRYFPINESSYEHPFEKMAYEISNY